VGSQAAVGTELKKYGLRYDDLLDPINNLDVDEAMRRLPQHVRCGATRSKGRALFGACCRGAQLRLTPPCLARRLLTR
jgi:hypothetical protein